MLSAAAEFGIRLEAFITSLTSMLDTESLAYKLNELEEDLLSIIGTMNDETLRPIVTAFITNLNNDLAPIMQPRDLHITNKSFITDNTFTETDILPFPIGGTIPSRYSNLIKVHSIGGCGDGTSIILNYLNSAGSAVFTSKFDITYQLASWSTISETNEPGYVHQWRWISAFKHDLTGPDFYANRPIYRSVELGIRELVPTTNYVGFNISGDVSGSANGEIMHDIGMVYDTPADDSCIEAKVGV